MTQILLESAAPERHRGCREPLQQTTRPCNAIIRAARLRTAHEDRREYKLLSNAQHLAPPIDIAVMMTMHDSTVSDTPLLGTGSWCAVGALTPSSVNVCSSTSPSALISAACAPESSELFSRDDGEGTGCDCRITLDVVRLKIVGFPKGFKSATGSCSPIWPAELNRCFGPEWAQNGRRSPTIRTALVNAHGGARRLH